MATPLQPIAKCIANWLYAQASAQLQKLRSIIEAQIILIDAQILWLRSQLLLAQPLLIAEQLLWDKINEGIEKVKNVLLSDIPGPIDNACPEFYSYIVDPAIGLLDASLAAFSPYRSRLLDKISIVSYYDKLITYWEAAKAQLLAILDILDDALYLALQREANQVP